MSGHSKFANIKHKKEKNDAAKGKIFTAANILVRSPAGFRPPGIFRIHHQQAPLLHWRGRIGGIRHPR